MIIKGGVVEPLVMILLNDNNIITQPLVQVIVLHPFALLLLVTKHVVAKPLIMLLFVLGVISV